MDKIYLEDMVVRFSQEPDCCQKDDETQIIEIHSEDNGVGTFFWLKTDRWSFSEPDDLVKLAERIRAMEETNNKYENGEVIYNNSTDDKSANNNIKQTEYIDLGLPSGTLWANMNLGATSETDYGDYYMWGAIEPNTDYYCNWENTPFNNGAYKCDEVYFNAHKSEWLDDNDNLKPEYDVAYKATNGMARMPTSVEFQELYDNTNHEWVEGFNGSQVKGWKFISKTDITKYVFFPANGFGRDRQIIYRGSGGLYWSSSLYPSSTYYGLCLEFLSGSIIPQAHSSRFYEFCVRSVIGQDTTKHKQTEYIDLDLPSGLKWAKTNLGAETETEYGDYYMWGSTTPDNNHACNWANTPFNYGLSSYNEAYFNSFKETLCPNGVLAKEFDAVYKATNGIGRMPTKDEFQELIDNTTKEWTTINGVNGYKFTSKTDTSKYIFIPAAGYYDYSSAYDVGFGGFVWSSSLDTPYNVTAWNLYLDSDYCNVYDSRRCYGHSVRGVME